MVLMSRKKLENGYQIPTVDMKEELEQLLVNGN
jgi:hypothetical protein